MNRKKRILWVDDDKLKDRLIYWERLISRQLQWQLDMATSLIEAAEKLSSEVSYDALILDQQFPLNPIPEDKVHLYISNDEHMWFGAVLFFWLTETDPDWFDDKPVENWRAYETILEKYPHPNPDNTKVPIMILSVLEQDAIENACNYVKAFRVKKGLPLLDLTIKSKPIRKTGMLRFFNDASK